MSIFSYKDIYMENGKRVLEVNILPLKQCNFDCIFCPIGRAKEKVDVQKSFAGTENAVVELINKIEQEQIDLVFINSKGEALVNDKIEDLIDLIKGKGLSVRLLSNGYLLGDDNYMRIADKCDQVIGELKVITEEDFQKLQRPMEGYTLEKYISNMVAFNKQYKGIFIFEVTIVKGYNDDKDSVAKIENVIKAINPEKLEVVRIEEEPFQKKFGISEDKLEEIRSHFK
ncbi:radical SAM protein [Velocimicrobium porci]|uniref:Radical SAM protein n=1 Tax=Velocimicrobium porci TaxID=2606634 RepID=A0A6L5Y224_9FIRM|nr:radical SAM protein [Velocimicrobium porci]MSS64153.1 radical SAM protein [Velocimicrobium porci]